MEEEGIQTLSVDSVDHPFALTAVMHSMVKNDNRSSSPWSRRPSDGQDRPALDEVTEEEAVRTHSSGGHLGSRWHPV